LLAKEEDEDDINRGLDASAKDNVYCARAWPSASEVNAKAGVEIVDRDAKRGVFFPREASRVVGGDGDVAKVDESSDDVLKIGGDVGVLVRAAFDVPSGEECESNSKMFDDGVVGHYFPEMPCLACGAPWWLGEDWNSRCANCGADDRCYGADQQPLRSHRRAYAGFVRALERLKIKQDPSS